MIQATADFRLGGQLSQSWRALIDWFSSLDWGTVPEWFAAIGTVGAFSLTLLLIARERQRSTQLDADSLVAWSDVGEMITADDSTRFQVVVSATNTGARPIPKVSFFVTAESGGRMHAAFNHLTQRSGGSGLDSGENSWASVAFNFEVVDYRAIVYFHDSHGREWFRDIGTNKYLGIKEGRRLRQSAIAHRK